MKKYRNYIIAIVSILAFLTLICFMPISVSRLIPKIESQVAEDFGVKVHIEKLVLRLGPTLKLKTPIMHLMYKDGQKFAQLDAVKLYVSWASVLKNSPQAKVLYAKNMVVRVNSDDEYLDEIIDKINGKDFSKLPDMHLKGYKITYYNKENSDRYMLSGQTLDLTKVPYFRNFKINTNGNLLINDKQHLNYDISLLPKLDLKEISKDSLNTELLDKIKDLDFHSDLITDLKIYKNTPETVQASGFINIDNISVLDKNEKNPKSFIYLTLWGDKGSILSNIYTSQNKKVYLEGMINNSKKPTVDLKVKTDEIDLGDLYQKLKIFSDISCLKSVSSLSGKMIANFNLKGDLNKLKSNGYMKISNASLKSNGFKVEDINSDIDFSNNSINISKALGYVNKSPLMLKGTINKEVSLELLMNKVELKHLLPESYGVKSGIISLVADISGTADNISHKENLQIENFSAEYEDKSISAESLKYDTNKNNTAYINNIVLQIPDVAPVKIPSMRVVIDNDKIILPVTNVFMPNSRLTISGKAINTTNNDMSFNIQSNGFIHSSDLKKVTSYATIYPVKASVNGNKSVQNANLQVLFEKTSIFDEPTILNLVSKLEKDVLKLEDLSITGFSGKFSDDYKANLKGQKKIVINGTIENLKEPVLKNLRINTPQQLNINISDTSAQLKGDLFVNGDVKKPEIVGQLQIQNLFSQPTKLSLANCTADFNKNTLTINAPMVKLADSSMGINAVVSTDISKAINVKNINIKSKSLNTDTLLMYKDMPNSYPLVINEGKFYSERILASLYGQPVYLTAFSSDIKLKDDKLELKNMASELFNGKMAGQLTFDMKDETFKSNIMARGVSAAPIFSIVSPRNDTISGVMDFDTDLSGNLVSKKSLNGAVKFIVKNGRMSSLGKLEHLLYAQNVIADNMLRTSLSVVTKAITLKDTGLFKYLKGDVIVTNGAANIKFLQSQGPLMALFIRGLYYPETDCAKLVVLGRLSDEIVSGLGAFGDFSFKKLMVMLTGEDNKYNVVPEDIENLPQLPVKNTKEFRSVINGTIDKPSSVLQFNWISYSEKSLRQKDVPNSNVKVPSFVDELPY